MKDVVTGLSGKKLLRVTFDCHYIRVLGCRTCHESSDLEMLTVSFPNRSGLVYHILCSEALPRHLAGPVIKGVSLVCALRAVWSFPDAVP